MLKNLKIYEQQVFEASKVLGQMPSFLKSAGAKEDRKVFSVGADLAQQSLSGKKDNDPNCWSVKVQSPFKSDSKITIFFFPEGNFEFTTAIGSGGKYTGKWQTGSSSDEFRIGRSFILKGVKMMFTTFGGMQTLN